MILPNYGRHERQDDGDDVEDHVDHFESQPHQGQFGQLHSVEELVFKTSQVYGGYIYVCG